MVTQESMMKAAVNYADDANFYRGAGSPMLMTVKWFGVMACEAAIVSIRHGYDQAMCQVDANAGGENERDIWRSRGAV